MRHIDDLVFEPSREAYPIGWIKVCDVAAGNLDKVVHEVVLYPIGKV